LKEERRKLKEKKENGEQETRPPAIKKEDYDLSCFFTDSEKVGQVLHLFFLRKIKQDCSMAALSSKPIAMISFRVKFIEAKLRFLYGGEAGLVKEPVTSYSPWRPVPVKKPARQPVRSGSGIVFKQSFPKLSLILPPVCAL
jgi:hypothetical protein